MKTIKFTTASDEQSLRKIESYRVLKKNLNELDISNFTDTINGIFIIFECFPNNDLIHKGEQRKTLRRKTKVLELYLVLDYDKIMAGTNEENLQHIKEVFLQGCEEFLKPLKGFDYDGFVAEINKLSNNK